MRCPEQLAASAIWLFTPVVLNCAYVPSSSLSCAASHAFCEFLGGFSLSPKRDGPLNVPDRHDPTKNYQSEYTLW
jgi:hypothetical protein